MRIELYRRQRSGLRCEWRNSDGRKWLNIMIGSPTHHRWWAFNLYLIFGAKSRKRKAKSRKRK